LQTETDVVGEERKMSNAAATDAGSGVGKGGFSKRDERTVHFGKSEKKRHPGTRTKTTNGKVLKRNGARMELGVRNLAPPEKVYKGGQKK